MPIDFPQKINPHQELIDLIQQFRTSTHFFYWLGKDEIQVKPVVENLQGTVYEGVLEYFFEGAKIFSVGGRVQFPIIKKKPNQNSGNRSRHEKVLFL